MNDSTTNLRFTVDVTIFTPLKEEHHVKKCKDTLEVQDFVKDILTHAKARILVFTAFYEVVCTGPLGYRVFRTGDEPLINLNI